MTKPKGGTMTTSVKKDRSQARVVPGALIVLTTIGLIALPWPLTFVGLVTVAVIAATELNKLDREIYTRRFFLRSSIERCDLMEWSLLVVWPFVLTHVAYQSGRAALTLVIFAVFVSDVSAFYGGRRYGRTKLAPRISPGKSYEGVACGLVGGGLVATIVWWVANIWPQTQFPLGWGTTVLLTLVLVLAGIAGDLNESYLKRLANIKDSGTFLRGHGGMLDRIDSLLTASVLAAVFVAMGWL